MQPIYVGIGLTVSIVALTALVAGPQFVYLAPHRRVLITQYGVVLTAYGGLGLVTLVLLIYAGARALGLADLGRKVDLVERSIRRGDAGDPELAEQMQDEDRGEFRP